MRQKGCQVCVNVSRVVPSDHWVSWGSFVPFDVRQKGCQVYANVSRIVPSDHWVSWGSSYQASALNLTGIRFACDEGWAYPWYFLCFIGPYVAVDNCIVFICPKSQNSFSSGWGETFFLYVLGLWDPEAAIKNFMSVFCLMSECKICHQPRGHSLKFDVLVYLCDA